MQASTRVIFNTGIQYARVLITVGINLYSVRLILNSLGKVDYGIYNLIAGVIAMLAFLNTAMSITTQRYLSVGQGKNDLDFQKCVFVNSFWLHIAIGIVVVVIAEIAGFFLFDGFLNIPLERIPIASQVYHFMLLSTFFTILGVPFTATLTAHENFLLPALLLIVQSFLNLGIALLLYVVPGDKLLFYGMCMVVPILLNFGYKAFFCICKYQECFSLSVKRVNISLILELTRFAGWNLIHALCTVGTVQGIAVLLNLFFGTVINAAYGIANQVAGQVNFFANSLFVSMNPQIMKAEGAGERKRMFTLAMLASKWGFFLLAIIAIPCIFEMPSILTFWLKEVPEYTVSFCRLILIAVLMNQLTIGLTSANQAIGKMKNYTLTVCIIRMMILPIGYILLRRGFAVETVLYVYVLTEGIASFVRLYLLKMNGGLDVICFVKQVFYKELLPTFINLMYWIMVIYNIQSEYRFFYTLPISILFFCICIYYLGGIDKEEKKTIRKIVQRIKK